MTSAQLSPKDAKQLASLRALHMRRASALVKQAQDQCSLTDAAVRSRRKRIEAVNQEMDHLSHEAAHRFGHAMPRWIALATAERRRLIDRLEREEFALADEMVEHEEACDELNRARAALARAAARQEMTDDLARQAVQHHLATQEANTATETDEAFATAIASLRSAR